MFKPQRKVHGWEYGKYDSEENDNLSECCDMKHWDTFSEKFGEWM